MDHPADVDLPISEPNPNAPFAEEPPTNPSPETSDPSPSSSSSLPHHSNRNQRTPLRSGYDGFRGDGYHALASFAAIVGTSKNHTAYQAFHDVDDTTDTFGFHNPLVFQASTKPQDPDLPAYFEVMTSYDREHFCQIVEKEIQELEQKN